jgi:hypothetical protein
VLFAAILADLSGRVDAGTTDMTVRLHRKCYKTVVIWASASASGSARVKGRQIAEQMPPASDAQLCRILIDPDTNVENNLA